MTRWGMTRSGVTGLGMTRRIVAGETTLSLAGPFSRRVWRALVPNVVLCGAVLMLTACVAQPPAAMDATAADSAADTGQATTTYSEAGSVIPVTTPDEKTETSTDTSGRGVETANLPRELSSPEKLKGMTAVDISNLLGPPNLIRHEDPAEVWQYVTSECVLDLVFYHAPAANPPRTAKHRNHTALPAGTAAAAGPGPGSPEASAEASKGVVYYEIRGRDGVPASAASCLGALVATGRARQSG
ncbi:MAG: hypothetical protein WCF16_02355 [Alphaproteobacteria bacterium]